MTKQNNSGEQGNSWKGFRPSGGTVTQRLSPFTRELAARYLKGEIGREMKDAEYVLIPSGLSEFVDWDTEWRVAGPEENNRTDPEELTEKGIVPDNIGSLEDALRLPLLLESSVLSSNGTIDLAKVFNSGLIHASCLCFTGITAASEGKLPSLLQ